MNIQMIPLNQLVPSPANVRKTGASVGIDELAASIAAHGLLQNLQVRRCAKGKFEVVAGGRRLAALKLLAKQKTFTKDAEIPCHVLDGEDASEISLAENAIRLAMHPADQFEAFHALAATGKGPEEIAARFGTSAAVVRQRLKLATVSPTLIELYRSEAMSLDQLMAFTVSEDHAAQEAAWFRQPPWQLDPASIRRALTAAHIEAHDCRVRFIGIAAYQAAGGGILRDLFEDEHEGYLTDPALLDRLVAEKLEAEAATVRSEGWKWVEIVQRLDYSALREYGRIEPQQTPLLPEQQQELDRLSEEYDALFEEHGEEPEPEIAGQYDDLSAKIDALMDQPGTYRVEDMALAGANVGIRSDGTLNIERGLIRAEDRKAVAALSEHGGSDGERALSGGSADLAAPLSARLVEDLTAERTIALRAMMQDNEAVALAAIAHALALPVFYPNSYRAASCLDLRLVSRNLRQSAAHIDGSGAATLLAARDAAWLKRLPDDAADLFGWLLAEDGATVTRLIAFCGAMSVDALRAKQDRPDCPRLVHADQLATALGLDMALWWEPTKERYLGRVSKAIILDAISEAVSPSAAENLGTMKKADLIDRAEERLRGKGWLPPLLRPQLLRAQTAANDDAESCQPEPVPLVAE